MCEKRKKGKEIDRETVIEEHIRLQIEERIFIGSSMHQG